ncbi:uncharacterized protein LOC122057791 [Macadamia integrifolia]|uniref:uncharacterized protein LOC122057791 n=1 Tax=Macadamia integrifolia TaxID=60698 RepID=UPI001C532115|nr:uncharacterized protein LOC122057791 [Macadamia integrifolia]XP_042475993.1 uncharacterized protein LOC122057791 [Macadamia integrifolia]XP_042475994.1 uncharacterized protein LOC122057791 [Macadamia integrifolia]
MIQTCSCSGGPASTIEPIRKRLVTASCKTCGGKPLVDWGGSLSGSMVSTGGLELTSVINPDLTWKTVSKGNRSASRRARRPISRNCQRSGTLIDKDPEKVEDMPVSESEKLGVTILGHRFNDKVEHIPIKKRRFLFRPPSPPPQAPSPHPEESDQFTSSQHASGQGSSLNPIVGRKLEAMDSTVRLGQVVDMGIAVDRKNSKEMNESLGHNEDFSGISILAAAACNNSMDGGTNNAEDGSALEVSSMQERSSDVLVNNESCTVVEETRKDHSISCAEVSNEQTEACISAMLVEETTACLVTATSFPEDMACKTNAKAPSSTDKSLAAKQKQLPNERNEASSRSFESLRDDRSHWDLNTVMDAWDSPCLDPIVGAQEDVIGDISAGGCNKKAVELEASELRRGLAATELDNASPVLPVLGNVVSDGHEGIYFHADSKSLAMGMEKSVREDQKADTHACEGKCQSSTCFLGKTPSPETNSAPNSLIGLDGGSKALQNQECSTNIIADQFDDKDTVNHSALPAADTPVSEGNGNAASDVATGKETGGDCPADAERAENICSSPQYLSAVATDKETGDDCPADAEKAENICSSPHSGKHCVGDAMCGIDEVLNEDGEDAGRTSGFLDSVNLPNKPQGTDLMACNPLQSGPFDCAMDLVVGNSDKAHCSPSTICEELPSSRASAGRGEHAVGVDLVVQDGQDFVANATVDSPGQIESEKLKHKPSEQTSGKLEAPGDISSHESYRSSENVAPEDDHFDDVDYGSDISHDDPQVREQESELQVGYDSQYEDGELKEPVLHGWEGNAFEEGEVEHVDYGSDNKEAYDFEAAADYPGSMSVQVDELAECQGGFEANADCKTDQILEKNKQESYVLEAGYHEKRSGTVNRHSREQFGMQNDRTDSKVDKELRGGAEKANGGGELYARGDAGKESTKSATSRMKFIGWDRLPECSRSSVDAKMEARDGDFKRIHSVSCIDGLDSVGYVARMAKTSGRELLSHIEGPISSDILRTNEISNNLDDSNCRAEREPASAQSIGRGGSSLLHMHGRGRGGDRWVDSSRWGPERHRSHGFGHPASRNAAAAAAANIESSGFVVAPDGTVVKAGGFGRRRQSVNASSEGVCRSLVRRGSPLERDEALGIHMELGPVDEMSPDRSLTLERGRSGRFGPQVVGAGLRERHRGSAPDDSSFRMQHPLVTRERSYSPIQRRGAPRLSRSRTKSPSRSRNRSPNVWPSQGGRNGCGIGSGPGLSHHSRSPRNFRSVERVRSPHWRPGFLADHGGFAPTSRIRGSPQHSSRWVDNRKDHVDHFREYGYKQRPSVSERRSPGRIFPRGRRYNLVGSTGRSKPDGYHRPIHPGRFPEMVGAGRGSRYDESDDDRRKHGHRYGFMHPVRRYGTDGPVKRFQYDVEDFAAYDSHNKEATEFHGRGGSPKTYDRGIDSRLGDAPRRSREEKGHFRYGRDWKYDSNSKSFGMRECDEDDARRNFPS